MRFPRGPLLNHSCPEMNGLSPMSVLLHWIYTPQRKKYQSGFTDLTGLCTSNGLQLGFQIAGARVPKLWYTGSSCWSWEVLSAPTSRWVSWSTCLDAQPFQKNGSKDTLMQTPRCRQVANSLSSCLVSWGLHQEKSLSSSKLDQDWTPQNCQCKTGGHFRKCRP